MKILVLGAGDFAQVVADVLRDLRIEVVGYAVDVPPRPGPLAEHLGLPLWWLGDLSPRTMPGVKAVAAIVSPGREGIVERAWATGWEFVPVVHPSASVSASAYVSDGAIICRGATVDAVACLEPHAVVNRGATVGHHAVVERFATVGPGAHLAGRAVVGKGATVGMGACVREGVAIGAGAVVGMGAVVLGDVPPGETWWGVPARKVER